jgi:general nucleoside transport system permease protein
MIDDISTIMDSTIRLVNLLMFAALGEYVAERAGTINISLEGMMLGGAYGAAIGSSELGSPVAGIFCGMAVGLLVATAQAHLSHNLNANQFVVGLALSALILGLTTFFFIEIDMAVGRIGTLEIPLLSEIPILGKAVFSQRWLGYFTFALIPFVWWLLQRTTWGLEVRSVGENPAAADASGVPVLARRRQAIYLCGILAGLSGAYLSVSVVGSFSQNMTAGKGFIAIAAVLFGGWRLWGVVAGAALFGLADALRIALPAVGVQNIPGPLLDSFPFVLALAVLLVFATRARKPAALAEPFVRGGG